MKKLRIAGVCLSVGGVLAFVPGCATKKYVSGEVEKSSAQSEKHISDVESQVEQTQTRVNQHEQRLAELDKSTKDAIARASEAGKLAQGKFNYAVVLSDDTAHFKREHLEIVDAHPPLDEMWVAMTVDPAISVKYRSDYSGLAVGGFDYKGTLYLLEVYPYLLEQFHQWHRRMGIPRSPLDGLPCC